MIGLMLSLGSLGSLGLALAAPGVVVLGVDGMDPEISQRLMDEGKLPHLARLAREGAFQSLGTANPPQSPVAWSNFVTGLNPGGHGIFDFVHRDPATYHPISSATPAAEPPTAIQLGDWYIPTGGGSTDNNRGGVPFWDLLHDAGVDVEIYRIPGNFPTPPSEAKVLGGMGTVDMRGGFGTYTLYTTKPIEKDNAKGDIQLVSAQDTDLDGFEDTITGVLRGPPDTFRMPPDKVPGLSDYLTERLTVHLDPQHDAVLLRLGDQKALLQQGEWSDWLSVTYDALPMGLLPVEGAVRFYLKQKAPVFQLYASPVNLSAAAPAMPISSPDDWSAELYDALGHYYTQGMPEETDALKDGVFTDDDYVGQVALVQQDTEEMLQLALDRFQAGDFTFVYLSDVDLQCHMLWRHGDPKHQDAPPHPAFQAEPAARHEGAIEGYYRNVDRLVGDVRSKVPEDTVIIVMSDHGFQPYTRKVNLNSWLRDQGYLVLEDGKTTGSIVVGDVDWAKTRAYGLGFNGLYLNLAGREAEGIVAAGGVAALKAELRAGLEAFTDPDSGARVVRDVFFADEVYQGERTAEGPDLIVGYDKGYGASDDTTLGDVPLVVVEDNTSPWSGNHLMSPAVVPGVIYSSAPLNGQGHDLTDLTVSILKHFGVAPAPGMQGQTIY